MATKGSTTFWVIGVAALLWNALGMAIYYQQMTATPLSLAANYSPAEIQYMLGIPAWANGAYGLAVTAGLLGSVALLMKKSFATILFGLSLAGILAQNVYGFFIGDALGTFGTAVLPITITVLLIAVGLVYYSMRLSKAGQLT